MQPPGHGKVRIVPLGGLGEIGMNCLALEQEDGVVVIDCGAGFPHDDRGVDIRHPDFTWLLERRERLSGVFITHGHEDHIGALPYLLEHVDVPVWGPPHALGLAERRISDRERDQKKNLDLRPVRAGERVRVGPFTVEPVRVAHSIVEATALSLDTAAGRIVHTGDFNFDPSPPDGEPTDEARLRELGDDGVALMLSDSTNVDVPEPGAGETRVGDALDRLIRDARGRVVIALFASNIQRLIRIGRTAIDTGRRICLLGRSLRTQHDVAVAVDRLDWPSDLLIAPEQLASWPRGEVIVLAGGSQGEPPSAMRRLAAGTHQALKLEPGDTVVLSSRIIPGNDRPVFDMMNDLLRLGVDLRTRVTDPEVHTSGHATRAEQLRMLGLLRPRAFVPVHGTLHHLRRHEQLAREWGVRETACIETGTALSFDGEHLQHDGGVPHGEVFVVRGGETITSEELRRRSELARYGSATAAVVVDGRGRLVGAPTVCTRGVPTIDGDERSERSLARRLREAVLDYRGWDRPGADARGHLVRALRRACEDLSGTRPVVDVHLIRLEDR